MKIRFWQKTYIFTLILFLLCFNSGIIVLAKYTYNRNAQSTETAIRTEQYYISTLFEHDYEELIRTNENSSGILLMQAYGTHYLNDGIYISFHDDGDVIYSNFPIEYRMEPNLQMYLSIGDMKYYAISAMICNGKYELIIAQNVNELYLEYHHIVRIYIITAIIISIFLAVSLHIILKKLSVPLDKLRKTSEEIELGNYDAKVDESGNDEFAILAKSINMMLSQISLDAKRKQLLVDNMAHELRTPLTSIHGYAEYLEKANATTERKDIALKYIISETERLQKISQILLDSAYIRENNIEMDNIDIAAIVSDVCDKLKYKADSVGAKLHCAMQDLHIEGNETLISMLFFNLIENAIKACEKGGIIKVENVGKIVNVSDNGKGMSEEQLIHIMEPFYRTDKARSRADGGVGLGLTLCKQIVIAHGASISVESQINKGTTVTVTFT